MRENAIEYHEISYADGGALWVCSCPDCNSENVVCGGGLIDTENGLIFDDYTCDDCNCAFTMKLKV